MNPTADEMLRNLCSGPGGIQFERNLCGFGLLLGNPQCAVGGEWQHRSELTAKMSWPSGRPVVSPDVSTRL